MAGDVTVPGRRSSWQVQGASQRVPTRLLRLGITSSSRPPDGREQGLNGLLLAYEGGHSHRRSAGAIGRCVMQTQQDWHPGGGARPERRGQLDAVLIRQDQIQQHDIGSQLAGKVESLRAIGGFSHQPQVLLPRKPQAQSGAHRRVVVDDQHVDRSAARVAHGRADHGAGCVIIITTLCASRRLDSCGSQCRRLAGQDTTDDGRIRSLYLSGDPAGDGG